MCHLRILAIITIPKISFILLLWVIREIENFKLFSKNSMLNEIMRWALCFNFIPYLCREVLQGQGYFGQVLAFELKQLLMGW